MSAAKEQLVQLIEAYAVAKATGNQLLVQSSCDVLSHFLGSVSVEPLAIADDPSREIEAKEETTAEAETEVEPAVSLEA